MVCIQPGPGVSLTAVPPNFFTPRIPLAGVFPSASLVKHFPLKLNLFPFYLFESQYFTFFFFNLMDGQHFAKKFVSKWVFKLYLLFNFLKVCFLIKCNTNSTCRKPHPLTTPAQSTRRGISRFTVVHMENTTIINKNIRINSVFRVLTTVSLPWPCPVYLQFSRLGLFY